MMRLYVLFGDVHWMSDGSHFILGLNHGPLLIRRSAIIALGRQA